MPRLLADSQPVPRADQDVILVGHLFLRLTLHDVGRGPVEDMVVEEPLLDEVLRHELLGGILGHLAVDDGGHAGRGHLDRRLDIAQAHAARLPDDDLISKPGGVTASTMASKVSSLRRRCRRCPCPR